MAEYVPLLRQGLRGERLRQFRLGVEPPGEVPIYLAAVNPKMLRLAGALADGVLLTWVPLAAVPQVVAEIRRGAEEAGRDPSRVDIALYLRACVTDDAEAARQWLRRDLTGYAVADVYSRVFRHYGFEAEIEGMQRAWQRGERAAAVQQISDRMVEALGLVGSAAACRERLAAFAAAGISLPVVFPIAPGGTAAELRRTLEALAPQAA